MEPETTSRIQKEGIGMTNEAGLAGMKPIDYLLRQMELEGIKRVGEELISRISPNVDEFPLVLCARTTDNQRLICFDDSLTNELRQQMPINDLQAFKSEPESKFLKGMAYRLKQTSSRLISFRIVFQRLRAGRQNVSAKTTRR